MLHTKFQGHRSFGSEEDFFRFLPYMGMVAILVMWPGPFEQTFLPPSHGDPKWNLASIGPVVSEEKMFEECRRRTEAYLSYLLNNKGSGELKIWVSYFFMMMDIWNFKSLAFTVHKINVWHASKSVRNGQPQSNVCPCSFFEVGGIKMYVFTHVLSRSLETVIWCHHDLLERLSLTLIQDDSSFHLTLMLWGWQTLLLYGLLAAQPDNTNQHLSFRQ